MINLIILLLKLFSMLLLTLTCMSITSNFINDKSNSFSLKITKLLKISIYLPVINIIVGLSLILVRIVIEIKENLDEFDSKNNLK